MPGATDPLPIVFLHYRNSTYLPFTLGQAKLWSMASPIFLIGDQTNNLFPYVTHVNMRDYSRQADEFRKVYRHMSPNGLPYELFCFLRWFMLRDFMRAHGLERLVHLDSDVLIYVDVNQEQANWRDYELSLVRGVCAGNMFANGRRGIDGLCDVIWDLFAGPGSNQRLEALYAERQKTQEGISDMVPLKLYYDAHRDRVAEMTGLRPDGSYWDANIHLSEGFEMSDGRKLARFVDHIPYCRHIETARDVRFNCLHFQGVAKKQIEPTFYAGAPQSAQAA
jgi:hypothetical protein